AIGLVASGSAPIASPFIPSFVAQNPGSTPITATITVTPVNTSGTTVCPGNTASFTITVNPTPAAPTVTNATICGPGVVNLSGSGCTGGTLNWYNAATGGTLVNTGSTYSPNISSTTNYW